MARYTIAPGGDYKKAVKKIIAAAQTKPNVVVWDRKRLGYNIIFCADSELASWTKEAIRRGSAISPSNCVIEADEHGIRVNEECGDESRAELKDFVKWILKTFYPSEIFGHESRNNTGQADVITDAEQYGIDWDWFAVDDWGYIGHFAAGGIRQLPASVRGERKESEELIKFFGEELPLNGSGAVYENSKKQIAGLAGNNGGMERYLNDFLNMASKGLFSFDADYKTGKEAGYFLVAVPSNPLSVSGLPKEISSALKKTKAKNFSFKNIGRVKEEETLFW